MYKVLVAQKGAREHFLAARALHQHGMLAGLVTDWYAPSWGNRLANLSSRLSSAMAARCEEIPDDLVSSFPLRSLYWKWRQKAAVQRGCLYEGFAKTDAAFARAVARLRSPRREVFFGYSYAALETLQAEKSRGTLSIVDQIDPGPVEFRQVAEEMARYPEVAGTSPPFPAHYFDRARREWELADVIVVNSEWSRQALITEGADAGKIEVLPLAYEVANIEFRKQNAKSVGLQTSTFSSQCATAPLRVLWLGQINIRKGIHYLIQAARLLEREAAEFLVAGPLGIRKEVVAQAPGNMQWLGPIPRNETAQLYRRSDVFVLPTLSDGFALTQLEALAHGLPVIVTPNCGRVVQDGKTGFIVPPHDSHALADAIRRFIRNRELAAEMKPRCLESVKTFSIDAYGKRLIEIIERHKSHSSGRLPVSESRFSCT